MKYIFTEEQFITLLLLAGQKRLYMFCGEEKPEEPDIISAMAQLYRRGQAREKGGRLVLTKELMELVRIMGQSPYVVKLSFRDKVPSRQLIYPGAGGRGKVIVMEQAPDPGQGRVKIWPVEAEAYVGDLIDNEQLPRSLTPDREEARALESRALQDMKPEYEERNVFLEVQRIGASDGKVEHRIRGFRSLIFPWIHILGEDESCYHMYSSEEAAGLLLREIRGGEG